MTNELSNSFGLPTPAMTSLVGTNPTNASTNAQQQQAPRLLVGSSNLPGVIGELVTTTSTTDKIKLSAVDAVAKMFKDPHNLNSKTPISLLQELCSKSLLAPPIYELVSADGLTHAPNFAYRCHLTNDFAAIGNGSSKKRAKHAAALAVLQKCRDANIGVNDRIAETLTNLMDMLNIDGEQDSTLSELSLKDMSIKDESKTTPGLEAAAESGATEHDLPSCEDPKFEKIRQACLRSMNPVGDLIEIAQRKSLRPPDFEFGDEQGPPHNRQFICKVKFETIDDIEGFGKSKKSAKRQAALKLLFKLKTSDEFSSVTENGSKNGVSKSRGETGSNISGGQTGSMSSKKGGINGKGVSHLPNLYHQLRLSEKEAVKKLLSFDFEKSNPDELNKSLLDTLAKEERFEYKVFSKIVKNEFYIFIQFQTNPTIVISNSAASSDDALRKATFSSLAHLILMCSR